MSARSGCSHAGVSGACTTQSGGAAAWPLCGSDHQRRDVLAVVAHRTGALALLERERARAGCSEESDRLVERALADHRAGQRVGVRVPLDPEHPAVVRVGTPAVE